VTQSDQERPGLQRGRPARTRRSPDADPPSISGTPRRKLTFGIGEGGLRHGVRQLGDHVGPHEARTLDAAQPRASERADQAHRCRRCRSLRARSGTRRAARPRGWWLAQEGPGARLTTCGEPYGPQGASRRTLVGSCSLNRERRRDRQVAPGQRYSERSFAPRRDGSSERQGGGEDELPEAFVRIGIQA
jgi:hypothetical protein